MEKISKLTFQPNPQNFVLPVIAKVDSNKKHSISQLFDIDLFKRDKNTLNIFSFNSAFTECIQKKHESH